MFHATFYLRRLHSIVGLLVLGGVIFEHIFTNSMALGGPKALNGALAMMELIPHPIFLGIEIGAIAIPLLFHAIYGIYICLQANNNPGRMGYIRNWQFALQRWTAWFLVVFLIWHVFYLRVFTKGITELLHRQPHCGSALHHRYIRCYLPFLQRHHHFLHDLGHRQRPPRPECDQHPQHVPLRGSLPRHAGIHGQLFRDVRIKENING